MPAAASRSLRVLAFDPGRTKTGVAIGNTLTRTSEPLETIRGNIDQQLNRAGKLCEKWDPQMLLVGRPNKVKSASYRYCIKFASALSEQTGITAKFADEYLTSQLAQTSKTSAGKDAAAAAILAADWLASVSAEQHS